MLDYSFMFLRKNNYNNNETQPVLTLVQQKSGAIPTKTDRYRKYFSIRTYTVIHHTLLMTLSLLFLRAKIQQLHILSFHWLLMGTRVLVLNGLACE